MSISTRRKKESTVVEEEAISKSHPLREWLTVDEFALVRDHVRCDPGTDLSRLATEEHAEIYLNTEIHFQTPHKDIRSYEWYPGEDCLYRFHFRGVKSGINVKFSSWPNDSHWLPVRDILLSCLARLCNVIKRLSIFGYGVKSEDACGFMGFFESFDGPNYVFSKWADSHAVLSAFAKAGHWVDSLQHLTILNHASSVSPYDLRSLTSLPKNLQSIRVAHLPWETDETVTRLLWHFPTLERIQVRISNQFGMHYQSYGFRLWKFLATLHRRNANVRSLEVVWNAVASVSAGLTEEHRTTCISGLQLLPKLERLRVGPNVWDGTRDTKDLAHEILRRLPDTSIRELYLPTIPVSKECLYEQLCRKDCQLELIDASPYGIGRVSDIPLKELSQFVHGIHVPPQGDAAALDFVFLLRRFRGILSLDSNRAASLWPLCLATAGHWKVGKGVSLPRDPSGESTHWLTDQGTIAPPRNKSESSDNLSRSLFYALLRERADVVCAGLQARKKRKAADASAKRSVPKVDVRQSSAR